MEILIDSGIRPENTVYGKIADVLQSGCRKSTIPQAPKKATDIERSNEPIMNVVWLSVMIIVIVQPICQSSPEIGRRERKRETDKQTDRVKTLLLLGEYSGISTTFGARIFVK